jgi:hypothetical protein
MHSGSDGLPANEQSLPQGGFDAILREQKNPEGQSASPVQNSLVQ